jgi:DNA-binding transcriptional LysR family regulator
MEFRHLRYFIAIAREGGFRRAATRIHVAQQALSTQIAQLEAELGTQLFDRLPRGVRLTPAGREFLTHAERIVRDLDAAREALRGLASGKRGLVRVGRSNGLYFGGIFGPAFHALRERAPGAEVRVSEMPTMRQLEALRDEIIDLGLGVSVPGELITDFSAEPIAELALTGMLLSRDHRLAAHKWLTPADVAEQPIAIAAGGTTPGAVRYMLAEFARTGIARRPVELVDEPGLLLERVEFDGFLTPADRTYTRAVSQRIVFRRVRDLHVPYALTARWRRDDTNPLIAEVLSALRAPSR